MSDFESPYGKGPGARPELEAQDFRPEVFERLDSARPIPDPDEDFGRSAPPRPPAPDPFEEFKVDRRPLSALMEEPPSLDGLFKPFNLTPEGPVQDEQPYEDLFKPVQAGEYVYEDLDTRDPTVIRTLAQAEAQRAEIIRAAEERASGLIESAVTEAKGLEAEGRARAGALEEEARRSAGEIAKKAEGLLAEAGDQLAAARKDREEAAGRLAEAEAQLAAAAGRIAGLDQEKAGLAAEAEARRAELEAEHAARLAELEAAKAAALEEARAGGHQAGLDQGLAEGRARGREEALKQFQDQVAGLVDIMGKMENIYNDLWAANEPMMLKLAIEAAEQILNKELAESRDLAARAFKACIGFLSQAHQVTFLARPQDIAQLELAKAEERERLGALVKVSFQPDETLGPGDLIVESDIGRLDATVKRRAAEVLNVLREAFAGAYGPPPEPDAGPEPPDDAPPASAGQAAPPETEKPDAGQ